MERACACVCAFTDTALQILRCMRSLFLPPQNGKPVPRVRSFPLLSTFPIFFLSHFPPLYLTVTLIFLHFLLRPSFPAFLLLLCCAQKHQQCLRLAYDELRLFMEDDGKGLSDLETNENARFQRLCDMMLVDTDVVIARFFKDAASEQVGEGESVCVCVCVCIYICVCVSGDLETNENAAV
jgi:hypothetical protein